MHPRVPSRGSVGASGDLAPLAHLALVLVGEGDATVGGPERTRAVRSRRAGARRTRRRSTLGPKEGLALINGTQPSTALAALALADAERLARAAESPRRCRSTRCAARSIRSTRASTPRARIRASATSAANIRALLAGSAINRSHENCGRVQDAYSMRCAAQVHGAARDALAFVARRRRDRGQRRDRQPDGVRRRRRDRVGRQFSGAPVALAADLLAIALAQLATISERRSDRLVNPALSGLPPFLTTDSGLHRAT